MKNNLMRILYAILGAWIGLEACIIQSKMQEVGIGVGIVIVALGIILTLCVKEEYLDTTPKQIIGLVVGIFLHYPIAYILQYLVAAAIFVKDIILRFEILRYCAIFFIVIVVIGIIYFIYDQIKYSK